jgi:spore maturation protein CgeB
MIHLEHDSMYFNGNKEISSEPLFNEIHQCFTIELWVKPLKTINFVNETAEGITGTTGQRFVIGPGHGEFENQAGVGVSVGTNGIIVFEHSISFLPAVLVYPTTITDWTHITIVYRKKTPYLYINGEFKKKGITSNKESVNISGFFGGYEPYGYYVGFIREIKIWNTDLTEEEINENLNKNLIGNEKGLLGYWTFAGGIIKSNAKNKDCSFQEVKKKDIKMIFVKTDQVLPYPPLENSIINALKKTVQELTVLSRNDDILEIAQEEKPDVILYFTHGFHINITQLKMIRQLGIKTAAWFTDDPYYIDYSLKYSRYFNIIFTTELNCVHLYKLMGCAYVFYLPLAADPEIFHPKTVDPKYQSDILFVGTAFPDRIRLIDSISDYLSTKNLLILGNGWNILNSYHLLDGKIHHYWASPEETANYYNGAKIVLNIHRSYDDSTINSNSKKVPSLSVNPRTFEIAACGAFQLTDIRLDLPNQYSPEYDIATYKSEKDLVQKLDHYLNHPDNRMTIAKRGAQKTLGEHTYLNRINKMVDRLLFN